MTDFLPTKPKYIYLAYTANEYIYLESLTNLVGHFTNYEDAILALYRHHLKTRQVGTDHKFSYEDDFRYIFLNNPKTLTNDFKISKNRYDIFANCIEKVYMNGEYDEFFVIDKYPLN